MSTLPARDQTRATIVDQAARLLRDGGTDAVTTRAVAAAAGVQAPTMYRLFGDKDGLLDAVAEEVFARYVAGKVPAEDGDPVLDLRTGWQRHIEFGLTNPGVFALVSDPGRATSPAAVAGLMVLQQRVHRIAAAGRLRVSERQAVEMISAAGTGAVLALNATGESDRDLGLADRLFDAVLRAILTDPDPDPMSDAGDAVDRPPATPGSATRSAAVTLRAAVPTIEVLSPSERALLVDWLERITG